jgi:hypothetical protein
MIRHAEEVTGNLSRPLLWCVSVALELHWRHNYFPEALTPEKVRADADTSKNPACTGPGPSLIPNHTASGEPTNHPKPSTRPNVLREVCET